MPDPPAQLVSAYQRRMKIATWTLIGCGLGIILAFGTCGLMLLNNGSRSGDYPFIAIVAMAIFASVAVITAITMIVMAIVHAVKK